MPGAPCSRHPAAMRFFSDDHFQALHPGTGCTEKYFIITSNGSNKKERERSFSATAASTFQDAISPENGKTRMLWNTL
jgi:hypothetical protein